MSANSDCCDLHLGNYRGALKRVICNFEGENILISFDYVTVHGIGLLAHIVILN
jgi:hypothetical protein